MKHRDYERLSSMIETPGPYLADGVARREAGCTWLEVSELIPFYRRPDPYGA